MQPREEASHDHARAALFVQYPVSRGWLGTFADSGPLRPWPASAATEFRPACQAHWPGVVPAGAAKYSSHYVASPLLYATRACGACHTDVDYVTGRVATIQSQTAMMLAAAEEALVEAINTIGEAGKDEKADAALLAGARALHRRAQLRWDFISAENSTGFHNPEEALRILGEAIKFAYQAELKAVAARSE